MSFFNLKLIRCQELNRIGHVQVFCVKLNKKKTTTTTTQNNKYSKSPEHLNGKYFN